MEPASTPRAFSRVLQTSELPPGGKKAVQVNGKCVLVCHANQRFYAISGICSHNERPLDRGRIMGTSISCPFHGARFDLPTGKALNLPATKPVATYEVRVVDEWIEVLVEGEGPGSA
jgi:3-phenylpropionate/trans-cinnamate dioxygenase ferredoxin subunit